MKILSDKTKEYWNKEKNGSRNCNEQKLYVK